MSAAPKGVRLSRAKGARLPEGAAKVDRSTGFGNPFVAGKHGDAARCVELYTLMLSGLFAIGPRAPSISAQTRARAFVAERIGELKGRDLACWCALDAPCHRNVLLEIASQVPTAAERAP